MSDFKSSNSSIGNGSSWNEADLEGEDIVSKENIYELIGMVDGFNPYMYEPEKEISSTSFFSSSSEIETSSNDDLISNIKIGNLEWCQCQECKIEEKEIDCFCCQKVAALNSKFDRESMHCITQSSEFDTLCLNKTVLRNVFNRIACFKGRLFRRWCYKPIVPHINSLYGGFLKT